MAFSDPGSRRGPSTCGALTCVHIPVEDGAVRLTLVGALDLVTADVARLAIRRAQVATPWVICDLRDIEFVDVSGLRVLVDAEAHAALTGNRLTIAECPPIIPRMLALLGLQTALEIESTRRARPRPDRACARQRPHVY